MLDVLTSNPSSDQYVSQQVASMRFNPAIGPNDTAWKKQYQRFRGLLALPKKTIQQILMENFTQHEARMFVQADRDDLKAIERRNTDRYYRLLEGRFSTVKKNLATKMTMMYFGLPVEPMISPLDALHMEIEPREPEGQLYDVVPPLHFLTAHEHRNWGKDALKGLCHSPDYETHC